MKLQIKHFFDASHQLTDSPELVTKQCARLHGHTYAVVVDVQSDQLNNAGMVIDFTAIKNVINMLDHRHVNDVFKANNYNEEPTAENIARFIWKCIEAYTTVKVCEIRICEGYKGTERSSWVIL